MAGKDIIMAKQKELKRLHVIHHVLEKRMTQSKAAEVSGLSERQIQSILIRPEIESKEKKTKRRRPTSHIPSQDHPWRKTYRKTMAMIKNPPSEVAA